MRYRSLLPAALGLTTLWLTACGNETTTGPTAETPPATGPDLAVTSNSWITPANMPANRINLATATVKNAAGQSIVYAIGGSSPAGYPLKSVTAYNVATNVWTFRHSLPWPVAASNGAGVINGKIYMSGGFADFGFNFPSRALLMYDPATNAWTRKHDMPEIPQPHGGSHSVVGANGATGVINGKLFVVTACFFPNEPSGYYENWSCGEDRRSPLFFRYNPTTDSWTELPAPFRDVPEFTPSPYAGGVINGKFYVMGGEFTGRFAVYDPATNQWTTKTPLALGRLSVATAVLGGKLFVMGGRRFNAAKESWETLDITIIYDPATDAWTRRAALPSPRYGIAGATVLLNGKSRIEVVGGIAPGNNIQYIP